MIWLVLYLLIGVLNNVQFLWEYKSYSTWAEPVFFLLLWPFNLLWTLMELGATLWYWKHN